MRILSIIILVLVILTMGCGFTIHYAGGKFKDAIGGHMVLGTITLILVIILVVLSFLKYK